MKKRIGLIGYGNYGRFVRSRLSGFCPVTVHDPAAGRDDLAGAVSADIVLLAVPVSSLRAFIRKAKPLLKPGSLVVDLSSVKVKPLRMLTRGLRHPVAGVHTLFGPESAKAGVKGLTAVLCRGSAPRSDCLRLRRFLEKKLGLTVVEMTAEEHDRQMAWVQGLSHFVGKAFQNLKAPSLPFRTLSFEKLLDMNHLLRRTTWPLFETIEKENPYAAGVRRKFLGELRRLDGRLRT